MVIIPILYGVSMAVLLAYGLNFLWLSRRFTEACGLIDGEVPEPGRLPAPSLPWPAVTVQLPLYNEALVVERLIDACAALDYPRHRLEIQVLDDSTDVTADLAAERVEYWRQRGVDMIHVRRNDRSGYKAGALQNGLQFATGDFIAIFDADFVPESDFLRRVVPMFDSKDIGMVQARWSHLNEDHSLLTRVQGFGLDTHFALEQRVRNRTGCFINFNGTAGVWRRACIEDAGGWQSDTLTEDLDLSYRAQLAGWRFRFLNDVEVPAELPVDMNGFRSQQFRWTKGAAQTARKMLPALLRSRHPPTVKLEGFVHLTAHSVYPFVLLAVILHAPLVLASKVGSGPAEPFLAVMGVGLLGFGGFFVGQLLAQRSLYPDWSRRLKLFPLFMAGSMGLSLSNSLAVLQAVRGRRSAFVRTPKYDVGSRAAAWWRTGYAELRVPMTGWFEVGLLVYTLAGLVAILMIGEWASVPFQLLFVAGFGMVSWFNFYPLYMRHQSARRRDLSG